MLTRIAAAIVAGSALVGSAHADATSDREEAMEASVILAAVTVCKAPISEDLRRIPYAKKC
jgi:hypothetical protein